MKYFLKQLLVRYLFFWARLVVRERKPRIVGVTGSVGKTTTKEAIAAVLMDPRAQVFLGEVGKSSGNLNTEIGLPLAILRFPATPAGPIGWLGLLIRVPWQAFLVMSLQRYPTILVLEYAADRPGDIGRLVRLAPPEVAVVTAVGPAHLERFRSVEKIAQEKGALVRAVPATGAVFVGRDNHFASSLARQAKAPVEQVSGRGIELSQSLARAVAGYFKLPAALATAALRDFRSLAGRLQVCQWADVVLLDDTYNANPLSMELAIDTLVDVAPAGSRRVAILGDMRELGTASEHYHLEIGRYARARIDYLIGVGEQARLYAGDDWFPSSQVAAGAILGLIQPRDAILVKGSRGVTMERVVHVLAKRYA